MSDKLSDHPAHWDWCPICWGRLDTLKCTSCGYDMMPVSKALSEFDTLNSDNERLRDALVNLLENSPVEYDFHGKYLDKEQGKAIAAARALYAALSPQEAPK